VNWVPWSVLQISGLKLPGSAVLVHRIRNVLARVPKKKQDEVRKAVHRIFYAACLDDARDEARQFLSRYSRELEQEPIKLEFSEEVLVA